MVIRRATIEDAEALAAFAERTFRAAFGADNSPEDMDAYCAAAFTPEVQRTLLADARIDTLVAEDDNGGWMAYAQLRPGAPPDHPCEAPIELWRFYVDPAHHGRGVAQRLMEAVIAAARARHAKTVWLGVWERNPRAQAFYRKAGFTDVGAHTFVLGRDVQTDRVMVRGV